MCKVCYPQAQKLRDVGDSPLPSSGFRSSFQLSVRKPWYSRTSSRNRRWAGRDGVVTGGHAGLPKPPWTWWERGWGRTRHISLGHRRNRLQERWSCSESVEKGAARADIPDLSKAPVKSQWWDFPKRKDNWWWEDTDASLLHPPPRRCCGDQRKEKLFFWKTTWSVSFGSHVLLGRYPLRGQGSLGWALIPEPQRADTTQSYLSGKEKAHFSSRAWTHQPESCSGPPGTQILSLVPSLLWSLTDLDKSLYVSVPLFPSCKMEIIILTFFIKCLANARQQLSTIMIIV